MLSKNVLRNVVHSTLEVLFKLSINILKEINLKKSSGFELVIVLDVQVAFQIIGESSGRVQVSMGRCVQFVMVLCSQLQNWQGLRLGLWTIGNWGYEGNKKG